MNRSISLLHVLLSCGAVLAAAQPGSAVAQVLSSWETPEYFRSGALAQINAAAAYQLGFTGLGVVIGIADSGLDARHPEFWGRVEPGYDFTARVPILPGELHDRDGHGTHVAGIAAGARDGIEMHGVAFDATVRPARLGDGGVYGLDEYLTRVWPYFIQQGVSIINASYGIAGCNGPGLSPCNVTEYTIEDIARDYAKIPDRARETAAAGVLMVVAAGNASHPSPDPLPGLPYLYPELQDNWISVVAVDSTNTIASFSNRCGVAREWCIAAPGEQIYSAYPLGRGSGTDNSYKVMDGTSQAAPVVSGVAALVKQAFPWFTAYDLQQTLFTTATDLGDPGVDDIYGWGLVNAGKAVRGYGMFTQSVTLDTKGYSSTFSNDISGPGGLVKQGAGTLTLEGANTYAGGTTVAGGTLAVDGTVAGPVEVHAGAVLAGRGVVGSVKVEAGGGVAPGNHSGRLFVNGDLTFSTGAVYIVALSAVEASRAMVSGSAALAGAVRPELLGSSVARNYTILSAGNLDGTFDGVDTSAMPGFAAALGYAGNDVLLRLTAQLGRGAGDLGQNRQNVAGALNDWFNGGGTLPPAFAGLFGLSGERLNGALSQASGEAGASLPHATFLAMTQFLNMVFDPHAAGRGGFSGGAEGSGALGYAAEAGRSSAALEAYAAVTPRAQVSFTRPRWSVWGGGYGGLANVRGDSALGTAQTTSRTYGFALGADRRLMSDTVLGFALAGGGTSFGLAGGLGGGTSDLFQASLYGRQHFGAGYVMGALAYGWQDMHLKRAVTLAGADTLEAKFKAHTFAGRAEAGWRFGGVFSGVTPYGAVQVTGLGLPAHGEQATTGVGTFALAYASRTETQTRTELGARFDHFMPLANDAALTLRGRAAWAHDYEPARLAQASFQSLPGAAFTVNGARASADALLVSAGAELAFGHGVSVAGTFESEFANSGQSYAGKGSLRYRW
ncbi:MAG TPA: S8 family serine peptidase [Xanthobacteraceae bacterium]|nr:S8 family serine peptidase [Xanthobacteraceae bacterium]